jgi:hypothetical protein
MKMYLILCFSTLIFKTGFSASPVVMGEWKDLFIGSAYQTNTTYANPLDANKCEYRWKQTSGAYPMYFSIDVKVLLGSTLSVATTYMEPGGYSPAPGNRVTMTYTRMGLTYTTGSTASVGYSTLQFDINGTQGNIVTNGDVSKLRLQVSCPL